jgi:hypothetical protein
MEMLMADPSSRGPPHFTIFKTAAEEAVEAADHESDQDDCQSVSGPRGRSADELDQAIEELALALFSEDVRLGIVRDPEMLDGSGALSALGGDRYSRRARQILANLAYVSDRQIIQACAAEPAGTPRGAAARAEMRLRRLANP